ncbi:PKD domain-containing protein [Fulvivirga sp. M361]|uniref:PKD domain-containing protein n=1 Tax=Fulvivirga sp. M361 TaxID=2594266 RepID=UPI00117B6CCB|nr:PKD domain-containing protein [Fulvivirga sp. M361]TRX51637.1 PKD domain-containing protein [Fulvivirga sp. M361]
MKTKLLLILILISFKLIGQEDFRNQNYFQNYLPQTPSQAKFQTYGSIPIDLYTGLPNVSIPLGTVSSQKMQLPINLIYDASGVKLDEIADNVGLHWRLDVESSITRLLRGLPDETPSNGYFFTQQESGNFQNIANTMDSWVIWSEEKLRDTQPDEFHVAIAGRPSFKIVFNNQQPMTIPETSVLVSVSQEDSKIHGFTLKFPDGMEYQYGYDQFHIESREFSYMSLSFYSGFHSANWFEKDLSSGLFNTKWLLKRMTGADGDYIEFTYDDAASVEYVGKPTETELFPVSSYINFNAPVYEPWYRFAMVKFAQNTPGSSPSDLGFVKDISDRWVPGPSLISGEPYNGVWLEAQWEDFFIDPDVLLNYAGGKYYVQTKTTDNLRYLTLIRCKNGNKVSVINTTGREDLTGGLKTDYIIFYSFLGERSRKVELRYSNITSSYLTNTNLEDPVNLAEGQLHRFLAPASEFTSARQISQINQTSVTDVLFRDYVYEGADTYNYKRLFLDEIRLFDKFEDKYKSYTFDYKSPEKLARRTAKTDNYGFSPENESYGALEKLTYPTGAYSLFNYTQGYGHRLASLSDWSINNSVFPLLNRTITYLDSRSYGQGFSKTDYNNFKVFGLDEWYKYRVESSENFGETVLTKGVPKGNYRVRLAYGNNGYEEYAYTSFGNIPAVNFDTDNAKTPVMANPPDTDNDGVAQNSFFNILPYPPSLDRDHLRGHLLSKTVVDKDGNQVQKVTNTYSLNHEHVPSIANIFTAGRTSYTAKDGRSDLEKLLGVNIYFDPVYKNRWAITPIQNDRLTLTNTSIETFEMQSTEKVTVSTAITEHPDFPGLVKSRTITHPDGSQTKEEYLYPIDLFDIDGTYTFPVGTNPELVGIYQKVHDYHVNAPLETVTYFKGKNESYFKIVSSELTTYKKNNTLNKAFPYRRYVLAISDPVGTMQPLGKTLHPPYSFIKDSRYVMVEEYGFNDDGNLITSNGRDGISHELEWGNYNSFVTASTTNPGNIEHRIEYEHRPGIGVTKITDENGLVDTYEYDNYHRLKLIKDNDKSIIERYRYHDANEADGMIASYVYSGSRQDVIITDPVIFTAIGTAPSVGETRYYWDFGNGDVRETLSKSIIYTYQDVGTYTVTLTLINPDYPTKHESKQIPVVSPLTVSRTNLFFSYSSGTKTVGVTSPAGPYTVTGGGWLSISNITSTSFQVNAGSNAGDPNDRTGGITVSNSMKTIHIPVTQAGDPNTGGGGDQCPPGCHWNSALERCDSDSGGPCTI